MGISEKKIWQKPWGYAESIITVSALVVVGLALQAFIGEFNFYLLSYPINIITMSLLILLSLIIELIANKSSFARWFCGVKFSVTIISAFAILSIILGLTVQTDKSKSFLGFDVMTRNWAFIFIYLLIILSLGGIIVHRFKDFKWKDWRFYLNHIGLWLLLSAAGFGYADLERYIMYVSEGQTEWRVYDDDGNIKELPVAITLNDFDMDYYPPKLAIIDKETGEVLPKKKPQYLQIDKDSQVSFLDGWQIKIEEYLHQAVRNSDSTYREVPMPGATPAVKVTATKDGVSHTGWVCGGNQAQLFMTLSLDKQSSIVMTVAEPRIFLSDIEVYTQNNKHLKKVIEVNKPLNIDNWTIYQYGYDNNAGRLSSYSSFELVYDSWLIPVYVGIIMMMFGSLAMIWQGKVRKEETDDME